MSPRSPHIVQKSHLQINVRDQRTAFDVQSRVVEVFQSQGLAALERILDHMVPSDQVITLDRLTLDLGEIYVQELEGTLPQRLSEKLYEALDQVLHSDKSSENGSKVKQSGVQQADAEQLRRFLDRGTTGWEVSKEMQDLAGLVARMLDQQPVALAQALRGALDSRHVRARLTLQLPPAILQRVIELLAPDRANFVKPLQQRFEALGTLIRTIPSSKGNRDALVAQFLLAPASVTGKLASTEAELWAQFRRYLLADRWLDRRTLAYDIGQLSAAQAAEALERIDANAESAALLLRVQSIDRQSDAAGRKSWMAYLDLLLQAQVLERFVAADAQSLRATMQHMLAVFAPRIGRRHAVSIAIALDLPMPEFGARAKRRRGQASGFQSDGKDSSSTEDHTDEVTGKRFAKGGPSVVNVSKSDSGNSQESGELDSESLDRRESPETRKEKIQRTSKNKNQRLRSESGEGGGPELESDNLEDDASSENRNMRDLRRKSVGAEEASMVIRRYKGPFGAGGKGPGKGVDSGELEGAESLGEGSESQLDRAARKAREAEALAKAKSRLQREQSESEQRRLQRKRLRDSQARAAELAAERERSRKIGKQFARENRNPDDSASAPKNSEIADPKMKAQAQKTLSEMEKNPQKRPKPQSVFEEQSSWTEQDQYYIDNAGLVLLNPFFQPCFADLGWWENGEFVDDESQENAVLLLAYMATGEMEISESQLPLAKVLCGMEIGRPVRMTVDLPQRALDEANNLLNAASGYWEKAGKMSPDQFRATFLGREGRLEYLVSGWNLKVDRQTIDILLEFLPWGFGTILLPWMRSLLTVDW